MCKIEIRKNNKGNGVYALQSIESGDIIEICPVVLTDVEFPKSDPFSGYPFRWENDTTVIVLGFGSLYNHSFHPNATYIRNYEDNTMMFVCIKDIEPNEEICTNYLGSAFYTDDNENYLGFTVLK